MENKRTHLLLDCDGVIVNSEEVAQMAELGVLQDLGVDLSPFEYRILVLGYPEDQSLSRLDARIAASGKDLPRDDLQVQLRNARWTSYQSHLRIIPGMAEIIVEHKSRLAVVSSSNFGSVRAKLDLVGLMDIPNERIFATQTSDQGKAATYSSAIRSLGVGAISCVAVEDSALGVAAAAEVHIEVWGLIPATDDAANMSEHLSAAGANRIFNDTRELRAALASLFT